MAAGAFAVTVVLGFTVIPGDSDDWWLHGLFFDDGRTGFVGWGGNQPTKGMLTRFAGSINGADVGWWVAAMAVAAVGLTAAVLLDRGGHHMLAILVTALVAALLLIFAAWPGALWSVPITRASDFTNGHI